MSFKRVWLASMLVFVGCKQEAGSSGAQMMTAGNGSPQAGASVAAAGSGMAAAGNATPAAGSGGSAGVAGASAGGAGASAGGAGASAGASGGSAGASGSAGAAAGSGAPAGRATWTRVWEDVLLLKGCSGQYCHGSGMGGLSMKDKNDAYRNLVSVAAAGPACKAAGGMRVKPSDPNASLLLDKMSHPMPSCGDMMPIGAKLAPNCLSTTPSVCTTEQELTLVKEWILAGARDD
ncbi:MAG TPA: hypothetical protein VJV78_06165 [Polyangiales bacterium]|nr:hypothetical protein [Polyangiales bacterium]